LIEKRKAALSLKQRIKREIPETQRYWHASIGHTNLLNSVATAPSEKLQEALLALASVVKSETPSPDTVRSKELLKRIYIDASNSASHFKHLWKLQEDILASTASLFRETFKEEISAAVGEVQESNKFFFKT
jgi:hypothetical protein